MHNFAHGAASTAIETSPANGFRSVQKLFGAVLVALSLVFPVNSPLWAHDFKIGHIEITGPWSKATPTGAPVAGGFFTIRNTGEEPDRLVSATGEIAERTEIHEMNVNSDGVMTMRPLVEGLEIPAGGEVELKPGSYHIMFMKLKSGVTEGGTIKGTLTFEKAGTIDIEYDVRSMSGGMDMKHGGHNG